MRILILGNMANDGYAVAKELRRMGEDVDLAVNVSDFGMSLPEWEDADIANAPDPYAVDARALKNTWNAPPWIRYFDLLDRVSAGHRGINLAKMQARMNVVDMMRQYDILEAHVPFPTYAQFSGVPYVVYDAGWIRLFPYINDAANNLAKRAYSKADRIIMTNPDTFEISDSLSYLRQDRIHFSPFAIDPSKYAPLNVGDLRATLAKEGELLLFSPSRQVWAYKGNDKMIRAYARFVKDVPASKLVLVAWSDDEQKSRELVNSLGISGNVVWIKPVAKNQLIRYYNAADVVLDQFVLGSWGTSTPEAMSCGKPVLMYYKKDYILRAFGKEPPILNSFTEEEIYSNLVRLAKDPDLGADVGKKSREWVIRTHSSRVVAMRHLEILRSAV